MAGRASDSAFETEDYLRNAGPADMRAQYAMARNAVEKLVLLGRRHGAARREEPEIRAVARAHASFDALLEDLGFDLDKLRGKRAHEEAA